MTAFGLEELSSILEMLRQNDVTEFRLERNGEKLWLKRGTVLEPQLSVSTPPAAASPVVPFAAPLPVVSVPATPPAPETAPAPVEKSRLIDVKSPMVGTFYRRPTVDADPYVEVGDLVKKGDVLCIVEAMKLMNEIESEISGRISEICLEDGQMAEFGEVLFRIDPTPSA